PSFWKMTSSASSLSSPFLGRRNCVKRMRLEGASSFQSPGVRDFAPSRSTTTPLLLSLSLSVSAAVDSFAAGLHARARKASTMKPRIRRIRLPPLQNKRPDDHQTFLSVNGMAEALARATPSSSPLPSPHPSLTLERDSEDSLIMSVQAVASELIRRCRAGEVDAREQLFARYQHYLYVL